MRERWQSAFAPLSLLVSLWLVAAAAPAAGFDGQQLYMMRCAACHGLDGRGDGPDAVAFAVKPPALRAAFLRRYTADELVRRVRDGTPSQLPLDLQELQARARDVDVLVHYLKRLPTIDWTAAEAGAALYSYRCAVCHGRYGRPHPPLPPGVQQPRDLSAPAFQDSMHDSELMVVVRHGREGMPALTPRVPESDGKPLVAFVRLLSPGYELYSRYCASCHGDDGLGVRAPANRADLPTVKFNRQYFTRHDPDVLASAVWHMVKEQKPTMPHYRGTLTESDARAIVQYLQQLD